MYYYHCANYEDICVCVLYKTHRIGRPFEREREKKILSEGIVFDLFLLTSCSVPTNPFTPTPFILCQPSQAMP